MTVTEMLKTMTADEVAAAKPTLSVKELYEDLRTHVERTGHKLKGGDEFCLTNLGEVSKKQNPNKA